MNATGKSDDVRGSGPLDWDSIDWKKAEESVRKLQARIVKAQREGRHGKARSLSRILTRSFAAKALAVKRVTQNQGKRTSGVDGELWTSPRQKAKAVLGLNPQRYKAKPLRRVYIPKSNGKPRPLGKRCSHVTRCRLTAPQVLSAPALAWPRDLVTRAVLRWTYPLLGQGLAPRSDPVTRAL